MSSTRDESKQAEGQRGEDEAQARMSLLPGLGPGFLFGLGFLFISWAVQTGLTTLGAILSAAGLLCFMFGSWRNQVQQLERDQERYEDLVLLLSQLEKDKEVANDDSEPAIS
jgi:hypothetical protein